MSLSFQKLRVGVLRGGPSAEYKVSLETGRNVLDNLYEEHYSPLDIFISRDGVWHDGGLEKSPESILGKVDVVFNALHGKYGEDGEVQRIMDHFQTPYTGSNALSSAMGMNKIISKKIYNNIGLKTPFSLEIREEDLTREAIREAYRNVPMPFVIKPASSGSSVGVYIAHSLSELEEATLSAFEYSPQVLIEEFINGKEATCGVIDDFRGTAHYALLPIEIRPQSKNFFDYNEKYSDQGAEEICPGNFSSQEKKALESMSILAHKHLGLRHYSRSDFKVHPKRGVFILETNSLPGLTKNSLLPKSLTAIGSNIKEFLHHVIQIALRPSLSRSGITSA